MTQRESHEMHSVRGETRDANTVAPKIPETTQEPVYASRASSMTAREPVVTTLHTPLWPLVVFIFYATLAIFTWVVLCIVSNRLIGTKQDYMEQKSYRSDLDVVLTRHKNAIRVAQILQAVVALLTIPITSAICSMALAAYIQTGSPRTKLNLRQTMALADQGWISPRIWTKYSKVGSLPLYVAFGLTLVGAVFQILQQTFVQVTTIQMSTSSTSSNLNSVPDIPALLNDGNEYRDEVVVRLRNILESATEKQFEPYLWTEQQTDSQCLESGRAFNDCYGFWKNLYQLNEEEVDAWYAPVVANFNTGVYAEPQYVPRINTTIAYRGITSAEWPSECVRDREGVFFVQYQAQAGYYEVDVMACMPTDISGTPWQATYDRQDITEELFLALSVPNKLETPSTYKVTARSSMGYYELPNVQNGYRAGPLLDKFSLPSVDSWSSSGGSGRNDKRATNETYAGNVTQNIGGNVGPLTRVGLALFGEGSFIERHISNPSAFIANRPVTQIDGSRRKDWSENCISTMPLDFAISPNGYGCLSDRDYADENSIISSVSDLVVFFAQEGSAQSALTVAAFLANKEWLNPSLLRGSTQTRRVYIDPGIPVSTTNLSMLEIIVGSVFLGAHLLGLLALAIYAFYAKPFMPWLGADFMVKAGTVHADILSAAEGDKQWKQTLAACPGFVGDDRPTDDVGRIAFGAKAAVSRLRDKKFEAL